MLDNEESLRIVKLKITESVSYLLQLLAINWQLLQRASVLVNSVNFKLNQSQFIILKVY